MDALGLIIAFLAGAAMGVLFFVLTDDTKKK